MALPDIRLRIVSDTSEAEASLDRLKGGMEETENVTNKAASALKKFAAAAVSIGTVTMAIRGSIKEAEKFETLMLKTEAVIKATGGAAGRTATQLRKFARDLALNTLESTDGILEAQQRLLTFRKVSGDVFDRTIRASADLSAAMGQSLSGTVIQLGRALEDPVRGLTALTRSGTVFTEAQKAVIEELVESNRLMEAQSMILDELEAQYGGVAVAAAQGYAGALDTLAQRLQEFRLQMNESFKLTEIATGVVKAMTAAIVVLTDNMDRIAVYAAVAVAAGMIAMRGAIISVVGAIGTMILSLASLRVALMRLGIPLLIIGAAELVYQFSRLASAAGGVGAALSLVGDLAGELWDRLKAGITLAGTYFREFGNSITFTMGMAFLNVEKAWAETVDRMAAAANSMLPQKMLDFLGGGLGTSNGEDVQGRIAEFMGASNDQLEGIFSDRRDAQSVLDKPLESLQTMRDLLAAMKEEGLTLPDILGLGEDGPLTPGAAGGGSADKALDPFQEMIKRIQETRAAYEGLQSAGQSTFAALGNFIQQFAGKSRAAAIAAIAIQKGLSIAQIISNTAAAQLRALAELGPIAGPPVAAKIGLFGKLQAGLVAATGLAQAAGAGGGSGPNLSGTGGSGVGSADPSAGGGSRTDVSINFQGARRIDTDDVIAILERIDEVAPDGFNIRGAR